MIICVRDKISKILCVIKYCVGIIYSVDKLVEDQRYCYVVKRHQIELQFTSGHVF